MEPSSISLSNYLDFSEYLSTGIRRPAQLAPQYELMTKPRSAIPRPIIFDPPKVQNVPQYYPSYSTFGEPNDNICTYRDFVAGNC